MPSPTHRGNGSTGLAIALGTAAALGVGALLLSQLSGPSSSGAPAAARGARAAPRPQSANSYFRRFAAAMRNVLASLERPLLVADVGSVLLDAGLLNDLDPFPVVAVPLHAPVGGAHALEAGVLLLVGKYAHAVGATPEARTQWLVRARTQAAGGAGSRGCGAAQLPAEGGFVIVVEPRPAADAANVEAEAPIAVSPLADAPARIERSQVVAEFEAAGFHLVAAPPALLHCFVLVFVSVVGADGGGAAGSGAAGGGAAGGGSRSRASSGAGGGVPLHSRSSSVQRRGGGV